MSERDFCVKALETNGGSPLKVLIVLDPDGGSVRLVGAGRDGAWPFGQPRKQKSKIVTSLCQRPEAVTGVTYIED